MTDVLKNAWPEWQAEEQIGKGSYGTVYKAVRRDHNVESYAAIKVISIPSDKSEIDLLRSEGFDMNASKSYFEGIVNDFVGEIQLMESLKGIQNIVSVEDYKVVEKNDGIGWDIYIRMELLTPFNTYICDKTLTEYEATKLGCDICTALEICGKRNIIHRDIKPENIFINDFGYFKLGDFGIARKLENSSVSLSQRGAFNYIAPEVARCGEYDSRIDIYSLGIVLYRMMNGNRLPFLSTEKQLLNPNDRRIAVERRLKGEELPPPRNASPEMADLILCACAFDPNQRFASASEMKQALMDIAKGAYKMRAPSKVVSDNREAAHVNPEKNESESNKSVGTDNNRPAPIIDTFTPKRKIKLPIVIAAITIVIAVTTIVGLFVMTTPTNSGSDDLSNIGNSNTGNSDGTDTEQDQIDSIIYDAEALLAKEDYQGAMDIINNGLETHPESKELKAKADEYSAIIDEQINNIISEAEKYVANEYYEDAIEIIQAGLSTYPGSEQLESKIQEYGNVYETNILTQVDQLLTEEKYDEALTILDRAEQLLGSEPTISKKKEETEKAKLFYPLSQYEAEGDYASAIKYLNSYASKYRNDVEFTDKLNSYQDRYREQIISLAAENLKLSGYYDAIEVLNEGLTVLPNDNSLLAKIEEYKEYIPVNLFSLNYFDASNSDVIRGPFSETDNIGEVHNESYALYSTVYSGVWATYRLNGNYTKLTGSFYIEFEKRSTKMEHTLSIYGDNKLLYTVTISGGVEPVNFSVDISGVNYLNFSYNSSPYFYKEALLSDVYLYKV